VTTLTTLTSQGGLAVADIKFRLRDGSLITDLKSI
jgi:hypothetical protein